jgi:hypothetical protein
MLLLRRGSPSVIRAPPTVASTKISALVGTLSANRQAGGVNSRGGVVAVAKNPLHINGIVAERVGFEPTVAINHTAFRECLNSNCAARLARFRLYLYSAAADGVDAPVRGSREIDPRRRHRSPRRPSVRTFTVNHPDGSRSSSPH